MVVTDTNGEDIYVVMGLEQYENLVDPQDFNEEDYLDEIYRRDDKDDWGPGWWGGGPPPEDIDPSLDGLGGVAAEPEQDPSTRFAPSGKKDLLSERPSGVEDPKPSPADIWEAMQPAGQEGETWDIGKMDEGEKADLAKQYEEYQVNKQSDKPDPITTPKPLLQNEGSTEIESSDKKEDEDFGEEQFYLEPIE